MRTPEEIAITIEVEASKSPSFPIFEPRESQIIHDLMLKVAREVQKQYDAKIRSFFSATVYAMGLSSRPDPLAALDELSERIARKADEFYGVGRDLAELERQRDAVRAFLGTDTER